MAPDPQFELSKGTHSKVWTTKMFDGIKRFWRRTRQHVDSPLVLMIGILEVESSYLQNIERPAVDVPDTIQFCLGGEFPWRLKTFAIDHDVHVFKLKARPDSPPIDVFFVESHIRRNYGDILKRLVTLRFADPTDNAGLQAQLRAEGLEGDLELTELGYVFYKPDGARYWTQSKPEDIP